ncbi:MAG: CBS domain-containing protein [Gammaproteobacteria bacterium]|nr:CBS domain-containing protein [Gammaproteobacteria bacterium]
MTASTFMNSSPTQLRSTDTIGVAVAKIMKEHLRSLPVVDENGHFLGVITVSCMLFLVLPKIATMQKEKYPLDSMPYVISTMDDLRRRLKKAIDYPVTICLKEGVKVVHPDTPIVETLLTLYKTKANLPVVERDSGRLAGMISYYDVGEEIMKGAF